MVIRYGGPALILAGALVADAAQAADWNVWVDVAAFAYSGSQVTEQKAIECNGTDFSYCTPTYGPGVIPATLVQSATKTSAMQSVSAVAEPVYSWETAAHGNAWAFADLATGQLKISDWTDSGGSAHAYAGFSDILHFSSTVAGPTSFTVRLHVDGAFEGFQQPRFGFSMGDGYSALGGTAGWADDESDDSPSCTDAVAGCPAAYFLSFNPVGDWIQFGPEDFVGTLIFDPAHPDFQLVMSLAAAGQAGSWAAFEHTATISFDLPDGLSFASDSGVFLTQSSIPGPGPGVPEPASWALLVAGFGMAGAAIRRRTRSVPA
ncbi:PEPxxWA-CTERM sorting domain-containing protein [Sphingomonas flavalba]|uniref:PEPxxWA-CTERM sorting domain-containing protein n=1 Tax=Sphingomonas flavalba TaxID=2559804 RepID=UPI00109DD4CE|nr:PEPxxWA-CTERM sorting domain-containing protein [Sphingomonas flavalba]